MDINVQIGELQWTCGHRGVREDIIGGNEDIHLQWDKIMGDKYCIDCGGDQRKSHQGSGIYATL